jgi:hypothetical protein
VCFFSSGVAFIFNQKFFNDLNQALGIDLENIVYYKGKRPHLFLLIKCSMGGGGGYGMIYGSSLLELNDRIMTVFLTSNFCYKTDHDPVFAI